MFRSCVTPESDALRGPNSNTCVKSLNAVANVSAHVPYVPLFVRGCFLMCIWVVAVVHIHHGFVPVTIYLFNLSENSGPTSLKHKDDPLVYKISILRSSWLATSVFSLLRNQNVDDTSPGAN